MSDALSFRVAPRAFVIGAVFFGPLTLLWAWLWIVKRAPGAETAFFLCIVLESLWMTYLATFRLKMGQENLSYRKGAVGWSVRYDAVASIQPVCVTAHARGVTVTRRLLRLQTAEGRKLEIDTSVFEGNAYPEIESRLKERALRASWKAETQEKRGLLWSH